MSVTINKSDGSILTVLQDGELDTETSPVALFGIDGSGEELIDKLNENTVHIMENFASLNPPANPVRGMFWYKLIDDYELDFGPAWNYMGPDNPGTPPPQKSELMIWNGVEWENLLDHYGVKVLEKVEQIREAFPTLPSGDTTLEREVGLIYDRLAEYEGKYDKLINDGFAQLDKLGRDVDDILSVSTAGVYAGIEKLDVKLGEFEEVSNDALQNLNDLINGENGLRSNVDDLYNQISLVDPAFGSIGSRLIANETTANNAATRIQAMETVVGLTPTSGLRSRIASLEQTVIDGGVATAERVDAIESIVFDPTTGNVNLGSRLLQSETTLADLPNQYASTTRVGLLESFVNDPDTGLEQAVARLSTAEQTIVDLPNLYASTTRVSNLESTVNAPTGGVLNLRSRLSTVETVTTNGTFATATRVGTLESRVGLTDGSGLSARIVTAEQTLVNLPNNYATATRATNLEATVNAATGGVLNLRSRIGVLETVTTDGTFATAERVSVLESIVGLEDDGGTLVARIGAVETTVANINSNYATSTRVSTIETLVNNPSGGITNLGSRIGTVEQTIVDLPNNFTSASRGSALESLVNAGTGGILNLRSRLGTTESTIADLNNNFTSASRGTYLESIVGTSTGQGLQSRVGSIETTVSNLAGNYTSSSRGTYLESQVGLDANSGLRARVGTIESTFANGTYATASRVSTLESRVGMSDGVGLSARIVSAENVISNLPALYASASQYNQLVSEVELNIRSWRQSTDPGSAAGDGDVWYNTGDNNRVYRRLNGTWAEVTDARTAAILAELVAARNGNPSLSARISALSTTLVDQINLRAEASVVESLSTTVGGHTTSINSHTTSINGIMAEYGMFINNNGVLSGWSLNSTLVANGAVESAMKIQVDRLQVVNSTGSVSSVPFEIVGGVVYIKSAMIRNLSVSQLTAGTMSETMSVGNTNISIDGPNARIVIYD